MGTHGDATEAAVIRAVVEELRQKPGAEGSLTVADFVLRCASVRVKAPDILNKALDRVTYQK